MGTFKPDQVTERKRKVMDRIIVDWRRILGRNQRFIPEVDTASAMANQTHILRRSTTRRGKSESGEEGSVDDRLLGVS